MPDIRLNLGSSDDHQQGYECVDFPHPCCPKCADGGMDADLRERWPWEDSSVSEIYAKDVAEHIGNGYRLKKAFRRPAVRPGSMYLCEDSEADPLLADVELIPYNGMIHFMNEAHRVLQSGGILNLIVPCYPGIAVWCDPTHASVWTSDTRFYFDERWNDKNGERGRLGPGMGITALFRTLKSCRSGPDWTPIQYAPDAPDRRKLFLLLEAVK